jgi:hypothetical protein
VAKADPRDATWLGLAALTTSGRLHGGVTVRRRARQVGDDRGLRNLHDERFRSTTEVGLWSTLNRTIAATDALVRKGDEVQYRLGRGPCVDAILTDSSG